MGLDGEGRSGVLRTAGLQRVSAVKNVKCIAAEEQSKPIRSQENSMSQGSKRLARADVSQDTNEG